MTLKSNIYLICGSGGVGKTTISAALGVKFAMEGKKAIVLTIDPARRLATALGIEGLTDEPRKIEIPHPGKTGEMQAMMLDTKRTFDRIVEKYAATDEAKQRIYQNKIYQHLSQMLAGTQEYMAMERLYEIYQQNHYDVIVVDTPPMQNALDFLAAPQKMMNMINNSMLHLLLKPSLSLGKSGLKFLEKGSQHILKIFDRITGFAFMQDISEMLIAFKELLGGFESRAGEVSDLLSDPSSNFITVCTTDENSISEVKQFHQQLKDYHYNSCCLIINRVYQGQAFTAEQLKSLYKKLKVNTTAKEAEILMENYKNFLPLIKKDKKNIAQISRIVGKKSIITIPLYLSDVHDIKGLQQVASAIPEFSPLSQIAIDLKGEG